VCVGGEMVSWRRTTAMRRPIPNYFTSSMSVQQGLDAVDESRTDYSSPLAPNRNVPTTAEELSHELRVWVADAVRSYAEAPERWRSPAWRPTASPRGQTSRAIWPS
jgi:hypothetical protein